MGWIDNSIQYKNLNMKNEGEIFMGESFKQCKRFIGLPTKKGILEFKNLGELYSKQSEVRKHINFLLAMRSGLELASYLNHLENTTHPEFFSQIRKKVNIRLPEYITGDARVGNVIRVAFLLGNDKFVKEIFDSMMGSKNLELAAEVYRFGSIMIPLSAPELKSFVKQLVDAGHLDSAMFVLDAVPRTSLDLEKEIEDGYKRVLIKCQSTPKSTDHWGLAFELNLRLGRMNAAASLLELHHSRLNQFNACLLRKDYVGAEQEVKGLHIFQLTKYDLLFQLYPEGRIVTKQSADIVIFAALRIEALHLRNDFMDISAQLAAHLLIQTLNLHKAHPHGNPVIEGFSTGKEIDALLLTLSGISFRNGFTVDGLKYLNEAEARHPEIMERL